MTAIQEPRGRAENRLRGLKHQSGSFDLLIFGSSTIWVTEIPHTRPSEPERFQPTSFPLTSSASTDCDISVAVGEHSWGVVLAVALVS